MNLASALSERARLAPDDPALVFRGRTQTYAQLHGATARTASVLRDHGVEPADRVALLLGNVPEFVHALYGTFQAGAVAVPLNVMLTPDEVRRILADAGAVAVVLQMGHLPTVMAVRD